MDYCEHFKGKQITVMGLGLLGRGVGDVAYLAECGADIIVTDLKSEEELAPSLEKLKGFSNITYRLGEHRMEDFEGRDMVLVAPSVPADSEFVAHAVAGGARKVQSAALFVELSKIPVIGVTGTRGKSTVAHMIHHVLEFVTGERIILGGNIRGVSNLQLLKEVKEDSLAVMELDSWQLQGFGWAEISPQIAVFTSFMADHLNYYRRTSERNAESDSSISERGTTESSAYKRDGMSDEEAMNAYFADKANIFKYQEEDGVLITTPAVFERAKTLKGVSLGQEVVLVDSSIIPEDALLAMPGEHNRLNAALALKALEATGLTQEEIFEGLATFSGVPGRLEYLTEHDGVKIFNDNNATTPQATAAGINALGEGKNIVLIAGGADKGIDLSPLVDAIEKHCKQVVLIPGDGTERLLKELRGLTPKLREGEQEIVVENLEQAVEEARLAAQPNDVILFSPAFASFSQFANEYERNDQFMEIIERA